MPVNRARYGHGRTRELRDGLGHCRDRPNSSGLSCDLTVRVRIGVPKSGAVRRRCCSRCCSGRPSQPMTLATRPSTVSQITIPRAPTAAALTFALLAAAACSSSPRCSPGPSCPPPLLPRVTFIPAINGKSAAPRKDGHAPSYRVRPGERLIMRVTVTVPSHLTLTTLWFGISTGIVGGGSNGTGSMHPILAHYRQPLSTGSHTFGLRWRVPKRRSGTSLYLVTSWSSRHPPANVGQFVAQLILS
jgi:hypothetical protein